MDENGLISYISPAVFKISGFTPAELTGLSFAPHVFPEDLPLVKDMLDEARKGNHLNREFRLLNKERVVQWVQFSVNPTILNNVYKGITGTITDITDKKYAEAALKQRDQLFKSIVNASPDVITITDLNGQVVYSSPKATEIFGYPAGFAFEGHNIAEFISPEDREKAFESIGKMFEGESGTAEIYTGIKANGDQFFIEVNGNVLRNEAGEIYQLIFITRDVTQRVETEKNWPPQKHFIKEWLNPSMM